VARFVAFVAGSAEALLLFVTLLDERLLERDLFGRQIVWCAPGGCVERVGRLGIAASAAAAACSGFVLV
jgi:Tfp pilus assembly protein PilZ